MWNARRFLGGMRENRQRACAASDVGLAPAAPSLSRAGGRHERRGPGPEGSPPAGKIASQRGLSALPIFPPGGIAAAAPGPKAAPPRAR